MANPAKDMTHKVFGKLLVLERAENDRKNQARWLCRCLNCGKEIVVLGTSLRQGVVWSCGSRECRNIKDKPEPAKTAENGPVTLCFGCQNAVGKCSWSARFEPVPGWDAKPTEIKTVGGQTCSSFLVRACPQYVPD